MVDAPPRLVLPKLTLPTRLVLAAFLISAGIGYFAALVQMHFQHASPGKMLPDADDTAAVFYGRTQISEMERLLLADEGKPFNGAGSMRQTFTIKSAGWKGAISKRARAKQITLAQAEAELRSERDGERIAVLDWIRTGANRETYEGNSHVLSLPLRKHPITEEFVEEDMTGEKRVKIASILEKRCSRCHAETVGGSAAQFPLEDWEHVHEYCEVETAGGGVSLKKLAQTTHVHLLGFALLYGVTGLILSFSTYPGWLRAGLAPLPLLAQVIDIGFWWLGRADPVYAKAIIFSGSIVAMSFGAQIILSLFNLFGKTGKTVLILALIATAFGGYVVKEKVIDPYLEKEAVIGIEAE